MKRLAFVALALVLGLGTLELGSRLVEPLLQSSPRTHPVYGSDDPRFLVLDPECGYRLRAHSEGTYLARTGARRPYRINGIGCADGEIGRAHV